MSAYLLLRHEVLAEVVWEAVLQLSRRLRSAYYIKADGEQSPKHKPLAARTPQLIGILSRPIRAESHRLCVSAARTAGVVQAALLAPPLSAGYVLVLDSDGGRREAQGEPKRADGSAGGVRRRSAGRRHESAAPASRLLCAATMHRRQCAEQRRHAADVTSQGGRVIASGVARARAQRQTGSRQLWLRRC